MPGATAGQTVTTDSSLALQCFLDLFPYRANSSIRHSGSETWRPVSRYHDVSDDEIARCISTGAKVSRALRFDLRSRFLALQLYASGCYSTSSAAMQIQQLIAARGIKTRQYQYNQDRLIYIFFDDWTDIESLSSALRAYLIERGIDCQSANLDLIANQTLFPIPLQPGFTWVSDSGQRLFSREEISIESAIALFLSDLKRFANQSSSVFAALHQGANQLTEPDLVSHTFDQIQTIAILRANSEPSLVKLPPMQGSVSVHLDKVEACMETRPPPQKLAKFANKQRAPSEPNHWFSTLIAIFDRQPTGGRQKRLCRIKEVPVP